MKALAQSPVPPKIKQELNGDTSESSLPDGSCHQGRMRILAAECVALSGLHGSMTVTPGAETCMRKDRGARVAQDMWATSEDSHSAAEPFWRKPDGEQASERACGYRYRLCGTWADLTQEQRAAIRGSLHSEGDRRWVMERPDCGRRGGCRGGKRPCSGGVMASVPGGLQRDRL